MAKKRKPQSNSAMSFIDVMSCGLGAVILLFFILDFRAGVAPSGDIDAEIAEIENQIEQLTQKTSSLEDNVSQSKSQLQKLAESISNKTVSGIEMELRQSDIAEQNAALSARLKEQNKRGALENVKTPGLDGQLLGIPIQGEVIAVVLDQSASMSSDRIADVIDKQIIGGSVTLAQGRKWKQSKRLANWVINQAPDTSVVHVIVFSEQANLLSSASGDKQLNEKLQTQGKIDNLLPEGGTNLPLAIEKLNELSPRPTNIYLITDGLPTKAHPNKGRVRGCGRSPNKVSGKCRESIFAQAISLLKLRARVDVFLLPMEGDPQAAPKFFSWVKPRRGRLMSVAQGWP